MCIIPTIGQRTSLILKIEQVWILLHCIIKMPSLSSSTSSVPVFEVNSVAYYSSIVHYLQEHNNSHQYVQNIKN